MMVAKGGKTHLYSHWDFLQAFITLIQEKERIYLLFYLEN